MLYSKELVSILMVCLAVEDTNFVHFVACAGPLLSKGEITTPALPGALACVREHVVATLVGDGEFFVAELALHDVVEPSSSVVPYSHL